MKKPKKLLESLIAPFFGRKKEGKEEDLEEIAVREQKVFRYETLVAATRNFNPKQKLGEGGFGPVFKGRLEDGREVAVKRLGRLSRQGAREFQNEVMLLSTVQHRNVVTLHGYCAHADEQLLVYEYVPNESLDKLLFSKEGDSKKVELEWKLRKNSAFSPLPDPDADNLLEWAWNLHKKGQTLELMDPALVPTADAEQVAMCIQVGLLCTQCDPKLRPDMKRVVMILSRKPSILEEPTQPGIPRTRFMSSHRARGSRTASGSSGGASSSTVNSASTSVASTSTTTTTTRYHSSYQEQRSV
ncbi:hypothetical protein OPV22_005088 [Ensete ventricosum]|uniref:Protein kinase domain-containing protein n=1 Tax=Ensete ventricosum TaxID=4639 RepID=A0AAV8Q852_ENSVE|nr:hypothetical protein OPV22_005088 [Ensete ventricosum]